MFLCGTKINDKDFHNDQKNGFLGTLKNNATSQNDIEQLVYKNSFQP